MMKSKLINGETRAEKLIQLNSLHYDVLLKEREGKFYLYIPEISLVAVGDDLNQAYENLCQQKQDFFNKILDCEGEDEVNLPFKMRRNNETLYQLKMFALKLVIICVLAGSTILFGAVAVKDKIANISGGDIVKKVTKGVALEAAKFTNTSEELKQIRTKKFRQFLETFRPWINEFNDVFSLESNEEAKKGGNK